MYISIVQAQCSLYLYQYTTSSDILCSEELYKHFSHLFLFCFFLFWYQLSNHFIYIK